MIRYGFFNAKKLMTGDYDRKYNADDVNAYFKGAISQDGIYQFVGNQCRVIPAGNMNVYVRDGKGQINYHWFEVSANEILPIREAHATLNRYTAIVARYDAANRNIYLLTVDGTDAEHPSKPQMQKTDTLRDICLAYVYVAAGTTEITRADIEDTVEDVELCGFVKTLLENRSAVIQVRTLPIPSRTCQGNIYYLIEESKTAGKTYEKGYYYCEPSRTQYDFIDFDWTSDTLANRPVASADYIDILFYANDSNKWYRCVEISEDTYEWQEVTVNEVEELPEPTEELNNQFYIIGNTLYKVAKQESNYKWYMFGTGGGGGHGDFAIIRIEYPEGTEVQVTFDGDTVDAPDTSGVWIYGCDGAGTYTVGIKNSTTTKDVEITAAGQVEDIFISPQVINYALLYYLGNEFEEPTEAEKQYAIKTAGWITYNNTGLYASNGYPGSAGYKTSVNINTSDYSKMVVYRTHVTSYNSGGSNSHRFSSVGQSYNNSNSVFSNSIFNEERGNANQTYKGFVFVGLNNYGNNYISFAASTHTVGSGSQVNYNTKESNCLYCAVGKDSAVWSSVRMYCMSLLKQDDISGLSTYGSSISEILTNSGTLFDDTVALNWMVLNCTGDFMISALTNSIFINAMNASSNKTILTANEHWARFIALLSV